MLELISLTVEALSVPLVDPFVIASGRVDATRCALVTAVLEGEGKRFTGIGESACLPPVTKEDQPDVLAAIRAAAPKLVGIELDPNSLALGGPLDVVFDNHLVSRAGVELALLDALARAREMPLYTLLGGPDAGRAPEIVTDITLPILPPARMAELATQWSGRGFTSFKVKVGKDLQGDLDALAAVHHAVPGARFRLDANGGFTADEALRVLHAAEQLGTVECYEQPCAEADLVGMARVASSTKVPVVADESVKHFADLARVRDAKAASGVNLKIAKSGGLLAALAIGRAARAAGMSIMVGGMVETRLGMTAATHLAAALGGVEFPDLDTAWLLRTDPFVGGYREDGPRYTLGSEPGLGVSLR